MKWVCPDWNPKKVPILILTWYFLVQTLSKFGCCRWLTTCLVQIRSRSEFGPKHMILEVLRKDLPIVENRSGLCGSSLSLVRSSQKKIKNGDSQLRSDFHSRVVWPHKRNRYSTTSKIIVRYWITCSTVLRERISQTFSLSQLRKKKRNVKRSRARFFKIIT